LVIYQYSDEKKYPVLFLVGFCSMLVVFAGEDNFQKNKILHRIFLSFSSSY
jgi:hypothetical protein